MTLNTLSLLAALLDQVSIRASAPDFEEAAAQITAAKRELSAAIEEAQATS